jgi:mono/diheme cytochrome c family protein
MTHLGQTLRPPAPIWVVFLLVTMAFTTIPVEAQESKSSSGHRIIEFDRDIRPILETSCLRCHGPERPKSHFRLDDRDAALKGGNDGVDILPGRASESPLLQRVASSDENNQMPPPGKGERLTPAQLDLLRAWIDQGADWGAPKSATGLQFELQPQFAAVGVHGDKSKFREVEEMSDGFTGGLNHFSLTNQISATEKLSLDGHFLSAGQSSGLALDLTKSDVGFIHGGFETWRQYYDNIGGYDPAIKPPGLPSAGSLYLDEGRAWVDFGLTPVLGPQVVLGYEEQLRVGNDSELAWGSIANKNIAPATELVNEHTHIIKLDVTGEWQGWQVNEKARVEIQRLKDQNDQYTGTAAPFQTHDNYDAVQGMNTFTMERKVRDWWQFTAGYYYSRMQGSDAFDQLGAPPSFQYWQASHVTLSMSSQIFSLSSLFQPLPSLSLNLATQNEWTHEEGFGNVVNNFGANAGPIFLQPVLEDASNLDEFKARQSAALRYTQIPWTVLFTDASFEQDSSDSSDQGVIDGTTFPFQTRSDAANQEYDVRTGFTASPRTWISLNSQYRFYASDTDYSPFNPLVEGVPQTGYPGFILGRTLRTQEVETKLVLRPVNWFRTTLTYKIEGTDFNTRTDPIAGITPGTAVLAGKYLAHTYGLSAAVTPINPLNLTGTLNYSDSRTWTFDNNDPSVVPYQGGVWMATASAAYRLNKTTDLTASYSFSQANYAQNNSAAGVPLGLDYTHQTVSIALTKRFNAKLSASLRYAFYTYKEPTAGDLTDFTAQGIFALLTYQGP